MMGLRIFRVFLLGIVYINVFVMSSYRKDSVLCDPKITLTEKQLSQEIDILTDLLDKRRQVIVPC